MNSNLKTLLLSGNREWRGRCVRELIFHDCDLHTASSGFDGLDLLRKHVYDIVLVDDTLHDMSAIEFVLNMVDIAGTSPLMAVAGEGLDRYEQVWSRCQVGCVGTRDAVARALPEMLRGMHSGSKVTGENAAR